MYLYFVKKHFLLFLGFVCMHFFVMAQSPPHYFIGTEELSNTDVYSLLYDDDSDLIYAATNRGVFYYEQNEFKEIEASPKQVGSSFFNLKKNLQGELFCSNLSGQVFKITDGKLHLFFQIPPNTTAHEFTFFFVKDKLFIYNSGKVMTINKDGAATVILDGKVFQATFPQIKEAKFFVHKISQLPNGETYFPLAQNNYCLIFKNGMFKAKRNGDKKNIGFINFFQLQDKVYLESKFITALKDSSFKNNFTIEQKSIFYQNNSSSVLISSPNEGLLLLKQNKDTLVKKSLGFRHIFTSAIAQNENGTIFLGTFKDGIIVIPNASIIKYETDNYLSGIATSQDNGLYFSDLKKNIYKHNGKLDFFAKAKSNKDHLVYLRGTYLVNSRLYSGILNPTKPVQKKKIFGANVKDFFEFKKEFIGLISPPGIDIITADSTIFINQTFAKKTDEYRYRIPLKDRGKSITFNELDSSLYYSTIKNVYLRKWNTKNIDTILFHQKNILGNDLTCYGTHLIIGTESQGILMYDKKRLIKQINSKQGLRSNTVIKVEAKHDLLFIVTTNGLQVYDMKNEVFIGLGEKEGVISEKVYNFSISHDQIWLLDKEGYYAVNLKDISNKEDNKLGKIYLQSVLVNDSLSDFNISEYSYTQNNFQFSFDYRNFKTKREARYLYRLEGASNEWKSISSSSSNINFPSLAPGTYLFSLKIVYRDQESETVQYSFNIKPPFWYQTWFILLCFVFFILIITSLFYIRLKRNERKRKIAFSKQKMESDIIESKLKAIRSQMNPHFIFNSLNSIQALVLKEDKARSYDSIERFSDLVRKTLNFSEKSFIPISDEVAFLNTYLSLESLRMKNEFEFSVINDFEEDISIPSLLIQPFLENSIHHGLLHKEGEKRLSITFSHQNDIASCTIIDNGIGREESNRINQRQNNRHQSFSLNAMKERLQILSEQHNTSYDYEITDLYNEANEPIGTKVILYFPFIHEY